MAPAISKDPPDYSSILIGPVSGCEKFAKGFAERGLVVAHTTVDTRGGRFLIKIANLESESIQLRKGAIVTTLGSVAFVCPALNTQKK